MSTKQNKSKKAKSPNKHGRDDNSPEGKFNDYTDD